jgi:hypothetical protein
MQSARRNGEALQDLLRNGDEVTRAKLARREVHADGHVTANSICLRPLTRLPTRFLEHAGSEVDDQAGLFSHIDEVLGLEQPASGVLPTHQRLHSHEFARWQSKLGLIPHPKFAPLGGAAEGLLNLESLHGMSAQADVVRLVPRSPAVFGAVEGSVGLLQEILRAYVAQPLRGRDSDTRCDHDIPPVDPDRVTERVGDSVGDVFNFVLVFEPFTEERELVAAQSCQRVAWSHHLREAFRDPDEQCISG